MLFRSYNNYKTQPHVIGNFSEEEWKTNFKNRKNFFSEMNASKLLNYYLQCFETERNCLVLDKLNQIACKSKIILYTYDSLLIDFNKADGAETIKLIKNEMESNKFPIKIHVGPDYHNMVQVKPF